MEYNLEYKTKLVNNYLYSDESIEEFLSNYKIDIEEFKKWFFECEVDISPNKYKANNRFFLIGSPNKNNKKITMILIFVIMFFGLSTFSLGLLSILDIIEYNLGAIIFMWFFSLIFFSMIPFRISTVKSGKIIFRLKDGVIFYKKLFRKATIQKREDIISAKVYCVGKQTITRFLQLKFKDKSRIDISERSLGYQEVFIFIKNQVEVKW